MPCPCGPSLLGRLAGDTESDADLGLGISDLPKSAASAALPERGLISFMALGRHLARDQPIRTALQLSRRIGNRKTYEI
jgi:hypothetical protein